MANAKALPNLQALSRSPSPAPTLPSEAVLDALKMMLIGASLNEVLTSLARLIEAHSEGMLGWQGAFQLPNGLPLHSRNQWPSSRSDNLE